MLGQLLLEWFAIDASILQNTDTLIPRPGGVMHMKSNPRGLYANR